MDWLEELSKLLPVEKVYEDVAQPTTKQVCTSLESIAKTARWIIAPIDYLAAQNDRYQNFLKRIAEKVPEERRIEAHPQIAGPTLDGLRFVPEDSVIAEMFLNLLARAIDRERVNEAHPAFHQIIAQLSPDEAVVLFHLKRKSYLYRTYARFHADSNTFSPREVIHNEFPTNALTAQENYSLYMDHLHSLNLAGIWQQGNQEPVFEADPNVQTGVRITSLAQLTSFGQLFTKACAPDSLPKTHKL
ncbi:MAG: hypothetical protein NPIRA02_08460 [Nitrospirales bacterium]|nr:MAG: hypothetical protein NPIRA02_08460 [Nitrospirales bacterium]